MQPNVLVCVIAEEVPQGPLSMEETRAAARSVTDLLVRIRQLSAPFPLTLALTDQTLTTLSSAPTVWSLIQTAIGEQRLELLLTGGIPPLLPMVPANLRVSLLREQRLRLTRLTRHAPSGAWLQGLAWDPCLLPELKGEGIQYTFLSQELFSPHPDPRHLAGPLRIGHEGQSLLVYPVSEARFSSEEALGWVHAHVHAASTPVVKTWGFSLERLREEPGFMKEFLEVAAAALEEPLYLKPTLPSTLSTAMKGLRWPAPACGMPRDLRERLSMAAQLQRVRQRSEHIGERSARAGAPVEAKGERPFDATWDALLALYPESERLYQRMLHISRQLQKIWTTAERRRVEGDLTPEQQLQLEQLRRSFLQLWHHAFWWPGMSENLYRRAIRNLFLELRLRLQQEMDALLFTDSRWVSQERLGPEDAQEKRILIGTPALELVLSAQGGAVEELHHKHSRMCISEFPMRRLEPYHLPLISVGSGTELIQRRASAQPRAPYSEDDLRTRACLRTERHARAMFRDLLLGAGVTALNLSHDQAPELLSLAGHEFEVIRTFYERAAGAGSFQVANSCWWGIQGASRSSLRIDKTFTVSDSKGQIGLHVILSNRGDDPIELQYGLEFPFTRPLVPEKLIIRSASGTPSTAEPSPSISLEDDSSPAAEHVLPFSNERAGQQEGIREVRLRSQDGGRPLEAVLATGGFPTLYWYAHETIVPDKYGKLNVETHGIVLTLLWKVSLWGHEKLQFHVDLTIQ